ncbi:hypothetical protein BaRGS_00029110 [Batillaria attramentaria]|uniref:Uncharacterized protein n=1 Tax=Batillaria attramentaria TaxID=370345 RepID=A0ABD0JX38_9CAEN
MHDMSGFTSLVRQALNAKKSIDQLPDKQLESRFNSLSLAFKTDRQTLEKRLGIQERSRDIAEQNIDKELQGLRDAVETLNQLCGDEKVQDVVAKIHHHLDILEHSVARVSSRAEVFGAVQQEKRMSLAMEVMITFTENIRRLREKEQADVEEARKVLSERSQSSSSLGLDFGGLGDRRSASVCAALNNPRTLTQRSRTSTPSPTPQSLSIDKGDLSSIPDDAGYLSDSPPSFGSSSRQALTDTEEPRQRFQSATANITVRNVVANTFRRASLERQKNLSVQSSSSSSGLSSSRNNSVDKYEEGLKASLGRELNELRDQQTSISGGVEQVMDRIETLQQEDSQDSELDETLSKVKDILVQTRLWVSNPNWQSASHTLRRIAAGIIFLIAMIVVILTFAPLVPGNITMRNHGKPAQ